MNKSITRLVSAAASAVMAFTVSISAPVYNVTDADAADVMTAWEITENMRMGWNLGNTLDAKASIPDPNDPEKSIDADHAGLETETAWGCPAATEELFKAIKAKGFNTVRIPTTWFQHLDENNNIDPEWMARVHQVVDYGIKNDMYIILNVHHENWINREDLLTAYDDIKPKLLKIWDQISDEFKDYDQHLIFECMNEPRAVGKSYEWWSATPVEESEVINKLNADFVELIRGKDSPYAKTRLLMLPGYCASSDATFLNSIKLPENDDYIAVSIHAYTPYNFTMNTDKDGYHDTFTAEFNNDLQGTLDNFRAIFTNKDIPVVIGEMGTSNFGNTQARCDWANAYLKTTKAYGIPCVLWDNNILTNDEAPGECHAYINRTTYQWYDEPVKVVDTMMNVLNDDSIVWGSKKKLPKVDHADLSTGKVFLSGPVEIDSAKEDTYQNSTPGKEVSWDDVNGKEVAIKYTGMTPKLCFSDASYGNWKELSAYTIDEDNGVAYYLISQLPDVWAKDLSLINHMQARTDGVTNIDSIVILPEPENVDLPEPKSKIYGLDLENADRNGMLNIDFTGTPDTSISGCIGFMKDDEWTKIEWSGKTDSNGVYMLSVAMNEIPATVTNPELQIWENFKSVKMSGYTVEPLEVSTVTTTQTTSTTTSTTTIVSTEEPSGTETTVPESEVVGDANGDGDMTVADAVTILQYIANKEKYPLTAQQRKNADVDGAEGISGNDALVIQKVDAGLYQKEQLPLKTA